MQGEVGWPVTDPRQFPPASQKLNPAGVAAIPTAASSLPEPPAPPSRRRQTYRLRFQDADGNEVGVFSGFGSVVNWTVAGEWVICEYLRGGKQAHRIPAEVVDIVQTRQAER